MFQILIYNYIGQQSTEAHGPMFKDKKLFGSEQKLVIARGGLSTEVFFT